MDSEMRINAAAAQCAVAATYYHECDEGLIGRRILAADARAIAVQAGLWGLDVDQVLGVMGRLLVARHGERVGVRLQLLFSAEFGETPPLAEQAARGLQARADDEVTIGTEVVFAGA